MQSTRIGDFEVHRVAEFEGPFFPPSEFFSSLPLFVCLIP